MINPFTWRKRRREQEEWRRMVVETNAKIKHLNYATKRMRALINKHTAPERTE